jgi:hypothetical protein
VVEEDLLVFLKLHAVGFARLQATETRRAGPWRCSLTSCARSVPKRITTQCRRRCMCRLMRRVFISTSLFMQKEAFWNGKLSGRHARCTTTNILRRFPRPAGAGRESCLPQQSSPRRIILPVAGRIDLARTLEGVGFGYNSLCLPRQSITCISRCSLSRLAGDACKLAAQRRRYALPHALRGI